MTDSLTNWVFDHLIWSEADERTNDLAMAAMAGDDEVAAMLTGADNPSEVVDRSKEAALPGLPRSLVCASVAGGDLQ